MTIEDTIDARVRVAVKEEIKSALRELAAVKPAARDFLTVRDIAKRLKKDDGSVREWIHSGRLKARAFGRTYRVDPADFEAFLEASDIKTVADSPEALAAAFLRRKRGR